jgi:hypothetical protein
VQNANTCGVYLKRSAIIPFLISIREPELIHPVLLQRWEILHHKHGLRIVWL